MNDPAPDVPAINLPGAAVEISREDVLKVAGLARLSITDEEAEASRQALGAIIAYAQRLRGLDLANVEPMASPMDVYAEPGEDVPGPTLPIETVMRLAPASIPPFISVPKVLGDGGGA